MTGVLEEHSLIFQDTTEGASGSASLQGTVVAIYEIGCLFGSICQSESFSWIGSP